MKKKYFWIIVILLVGAFLFYSHDVYQTNQERIRNSKGTYTLQSSLKTLEKEGGISLHGEHLSSSPLPINSTEYAFCDRIIKIAKQEPAYPENAQGVTKYGSYFNEPACEWCTEFALWCVIQAQNQLELNYVHTYYPYSTWSVGCVNWYKNKKQFHYRDDYIPRRGDMIFFDYDGDGSTDHTGLVMGVEEDPQDHQLYILTIEGNLPEDYPVGSIKERRLKANWNKIYGYGSF